ncbi:unnamed protein product [Amoebophrya sp. A25]|nr:unnamed protein product [Amoebophrya sp. A25]|eukprot:GSA25T00026307001.1
MIEEEQDEADDDPSWTLNLDELEAEINEHETSLLLGGGGATSSSTKHHRSSKILYSTNKSSRAGILEGATKNTATTFSTNQHDAGGMGKGSTKSAIGHMHSLLLSEQRLRKENEQLRRDVATLTAQSWSRANSSSDSAPFSALQSALPSALPSTLPSAVDHPPLSRPNWVAPLYYSERTSPRKIPGEHGIEDAVNDIRFLKNDHGIEKSCNNNNLQSTEKSCNIKFKNFKRNENQQGHKNKKKTKAIARTKVDVVPSKNWTDIDAFVVSLSGKRAESRVKTHQPQSSQEHKEQSSQEHKEQSSQHKEQSSQHKEQSSQLPKSLNPLEQGVDELSLSSISAISSSDSRLNAVHTVTEQKHPKKGPFLVLENKGDKDVAALDTEKSCRSGPRTSAKLRHQPPVILSSSQTSASQQSSASFKNTQHEQRADESSNDSNAGQSEDEGAREEGRSDGSTGSSEETSRAGLSSSVASEVLIDGIGEVPLLDLDEDLVDDEYDSQPDAPRRQVKRGPASAKASRSQTEQKSKREATTLATSTTSASRRRLHDRDAARTSSNRGRNQEAENASSRGRGQNKQSHRDPHYEHESRSRDHLVYRRKHEEDEGLYVPAHDHEKGYARAHHAKPAAANHQAESDRDPHPLEDRGSSTLLLRHDKKPLSSYAEKSRLEVCGTEIQFEMIPTTPNGEDIGQGHLVNADRREQLHTSHHLVVRSSVVAPSRNECSPAEKERGSRPTSKKHRRSGLEERSDLMWEDISPVIHTEIRRCPKSRRSATTSSTSIRTKSILKKASPCSTLSPSTNAAVGYGRSGQASPAHDHDHGGEQQGKILVPSASHSIKLLARQRRQEADDLPEQSPFSVDHNGAGSSSSSSSCQGVSTKASASSLSSTQKPAVPSEDGNGMKAVADRPSVSVPKLRKEEHPLLPPPRLKPAMGQRASGEKLMRDIDTMVEHLNYRAAASTKLKNFAGSNVRQPLLSAAPGVAHGTGATEDDDELSEEDEHSRPLPHHHGDQASAGVVKASAENTSSCSRQSLHHLQTNDHPQFHLRSLLGGERGAPQQARQVTSSNALVDHRGRKAGRSPDVIGGGRRVRGENEGAAETMVASNDEPGMRACYDALPGPKSSYLRQHQRPVARLIEPKQVQRGLSSQASAP